MYPAWKVGNNIIVFYVVGNFRGVQFSRVSILQHFTDSVFTDAQELASMYNMYTYTCKVTAYFASLDLVIMVKLGPLKSFLLYMTVCHSSFITDQLYRFPFLDQAL